MWPSYCFFVKTPYFLFHFILLFPQEPQPLGVFLDLYPEETTWTRELFTGFLLDGPI